MNNHIDVKVTVWNRYYFSDHTDMQALVTLLREEGIDAIIDEAVGYLQDETLLETEERLNPDDNAGQPTLEIFADGQLIWDNVNQ